MAKIISFANHKGGVGKTTTVASVAAFMARGGKRVLAVDLDAQSNLTSSLLGREADSSVYDALRTRGDLPVYEIGEGLHLVPSSLELAGIELELASAMSREYILKDLLDKVSADYDYILLDCPPALSLVTVNAFVASDHVIIPLTAEALPFKGLKMITDIMEMVKQRLNPDLKLSGILLTRWAGRKLNKLVEESLRENYGDTVFRTRIRENIAVAEAPLAAQDVFSYSSRCNGARDYGDFAKELIQVLEK